MLVTVIVHRKVDNTTQRTANRLIHTSGLQKNT